MTPRMSLLFLAAGLIWIAPHVPQRSVLRTDSSNRASMSPSTTPFVRADSIVIDISNSMPHPMTITYEVHGDRKPLGTVDPGTERLITIRDLQGDSVVVWATNGLPPHDIPHTFPTHSATNLKWDL